MPGGDPEAWPLVKDIFQSIAAKVDGEPCCQWVGQDGAGHFVKMVHNGIEYGDMQLIAESYHLMRYGLGLSAKKCQKVFSKWNKGVLDSYLIEITADIFSDVDEKTGKRLIEVILDEANQKGTGKWTAMAALDAGMPLTLIGEAVMMVSGNMTLEQVGEAIHPHPTQTELFGDMARRLLSRLRRSRKTTKA